MAKNTPDSAVILMPPRSAVMPGNGEEDFKSAPSLASVSSKPWSTYFLYPRTLHYAPLGNPATLDSVTHVAVVNNWGYEFLDYSVTNQRKHTVLAKSLNR